LIYDKAGLNHQSGSIDFHISLMVPFLKRLCSILGTFGYPVKLGTFCVKLGTPVIVKIGT